MQQPTFEQWLANLDAFVTAKTGLSIHDLSDCSYYDYYEDELSASEAYDSMLCDCDDLNLANPDF